MHLSFSHIAWPAVQEAESLELLGPLGLGEIELAATTIDSLRNACVLYHHARQEITLFFESEEKLSPSFIREQMAARLPKYMLPTAFHQLETLPLNANGKTDRLSLATYLA